MRVLALAGLCVLPAMAQEPAPDATRPLSGSALIDHHIEAKWKANNVKPAPRAEDWEFYRRLWVDVAGVIPSAEDVLQFLADTGKDKDARAVDALFEGERYAAYWAELWEPILIGYDYGVKNDSRDSLYYWLRDEVFAKNRPYDETVRLLIDSSGSNQKAGNSVFMWRLLRNGGGTPEITTRVARAFMGTQIQCAQCHDHPFDKWTQEDFYGVAAFFARVRSRKVQPQNQVDQEFEVYEDRRGEVSIPESKDRKPVPPKSLDALAPNKDEARRTAFARILTRPENLQFARAVVNRYWGHFFGRGIVHPVEEFNDRNRPTHPALLDQLAQDFIAHKYDLRWLIRSIVLSKPYRLSSSVSPKERADEKFFAAAAVRTMTPEQLFNSLMEATGGEDLYKIAQKKQNGSDSIRQQKLQILRQFRFAFGDDESPDIADFAGTIPQALMFINGETVLRGISQQGGRLDLILRLRKDLRERLDLIYLSVLGRLPTENDLNRAVPHIQAKKEDRSAFEDIFWALINSSEFMFNH